MYLDDAFEKRCDPWSLKSMRAILFELIIERKPVAEFGDGLDIDG